MRYHQHHHDRDYNDYEDNSFLDFPNKTFWLIHLLGSIFFFSLGMKAAFRKMPILPMAAYRLWRRFR